MSGKVTDDEFVSGRLERLAASIAERDNEAAAVFRKYGKELLELVNTGVFSNTEIYEAIKQGHIIIHPFVPEHVNTSSYDVTLGEHFWRTEPSRHSVDLNPFDESSVLEYFGNEPKTAIFHEDWIKQHNRQPFANIPLEHPIIVLAPGERILAHTNEFVGIRPPGTTSMQARSTWGRLGIQVCEDAGWGDSGFINRWTMEIHNGNERVHVPLPVGERVAQIVFFHTGPVTSEYSQLTGKYQGSGDLSELIDDWRPESMLPRAYKDQRQSPVRP